MSSSHLDQRPLIGVTTYGRNDENRFHLPADYVDAVRRGGGMPVLLPPGEPYPEGHSLHVDGLVFTGGGDIDPALYGGRDHPSIYGVDHERDRSEQALWRQALAAQIPTLAICRGMQMLNVILGGTLIEHLPDAAGEAVLHRAPPREPIPHRVSVSAGSRLAQMLGQLEIEPPSWHHQALREVAAPLKIVARAADGTVEAVELGGHPWLIGLQWHPEITAAHDRVQQRLFDALAQAASLRMRERTQRLGSAHTEGAPGSAGPPGAP
jgi:putative glutamine amidotransferase